MKYLTLDIGSGRAVYENFLTAIKIAEEKCYCEEHIDLAYIIFPTGVELLFWYSGERKSSEPWHLELARARPIIGETMSEVSCQSFSQALDAFRKAVSIAESVSSTPMQIFRSGELRGYAFNANGEKLVLDHTLSSLKDEPAYIDMSFDAYTYDDDITPPVRISVYWDRSRLTFVAKRASNLIEISVTCPHVAAIRSAVYRFAGQEGA